MAGDAFALARSYRLPAIVQAGAAALERLSAERDAWLLELAWDGHRVLVSRAGDGVRIASADFRDWSGTFPGLALALRRLPAAELVLEGLVCALDERGRPSFELLRSRVRSKQGSVALVLWDALRIDAQDLATAPLADRRHRLAALLRDAPEQLVLSEEVPGELRELLVSLAALGVRGLVARRRDGAHPPPTSEPWLALPSGEHAVEWERSLSPPPRVTNADKVLFPRDGFTKQDVLRFYSDIAPVLLPQMRDRPIVSQRWPDGIDDFTWFQHRVPPRAPDYVRSVPIEGDRRTLIDNRDALLWMVNQAALTFHGWASRIGTLAQPDWALLDLDPGESTTWDQTIEVALALRRLLELLELPSVVKTSGQKGLHVLVPLAAGHLGAQVQDFARRVALMLARLLPETVSLESEREKRRGRLFLDHVQGFVGKSLVLPYSLRAADGAPVSTPLEWSEVTPRLDPRAFTLRTLRQRLDARGDLAAPLLGPGAQLTDALVKLAG